jgi:hypothetical protein
LRSWTHVDHLHFWNLEALVNLLGRIKDHALHDVVGVALSLHLELFSLVSDPRLLDNVFLKEFHLLGFQLDFLEFLVLALFFDFEVELEALGLKGVLKLLLFILVIEGILANVL